MRRNFTTHLAVLLVLITTQTVLAQHSGHGMGGMGGGSHGHDSSAAMRDMQRMLAVQATEEQKSHFLSWTQNTEAVRQQVAELRTAVGNNDVSGRLEALKAAVEKTNSGYREFAGGLNQAQQAGLKKPVQKLGKANDNLTAAIETAIREFGEASSSAKHADTLKKLEKAIDKLTAEQKGIASEMGIA